MEAAETAIWLAEVAPRMEIERLRTLNADANPDLLRIAFKLATGAGKTTVMAMLIAWQTLNAARSRNSTRFTDAFLIVAPGLTVRDRLRVLLPSDPNNTYTRHEIVPREMRDDLNRARIVDPTTGEVRSSAKVEDDVACWFMDTDYDGDSFFVRYAYFLGGKDPFERLKAALKADVDPDAWASLYATVSRPFAKPKSGRIAVKVINHYGDEAMRVFTI